MIGSELKDRLKALIYEDYLKAMAKVRTGEDPDKAFRDHEARVAKLRRKIEKIEAEEAVQAGRSFFRLIG